MKKPAWRTLEWLALVALFLLAGTIGHDPWKQDETYTFGIIHHFYTTHSWLVPTNAGEPFMEKPPLYYWTGVVFARVFGHVLPLHDAARLASVFYMALSTFFLWRLAGLLPQKNLGRVCVALTLGSLGLVRHAHDMFTDVALLSGTVIALYGMALLPKDWRKAGLYTGLGVGVAFLSKGFLVPLILGAGGGTWWLLTPALHTRKTLWAALVALAAASPFLFVWPSLLYLHAPALFAEWFWNNNVGRFLGFSVNRLGAENEPYYFLGALTWFAFPAFPLACFALARTRGREWKKPHLLLPLCVGSAGLALLLASASARALYLLPLLPVFVLLGAPTLAHVPPRWLAVWNRSVITLFSALVLCIWAVWGGLLMQPHPEWLRPLGRWLPLDFTPAGHQWGAIALASALTLLWLAALRLPVRNVQNTAHLWLAGVAAQWGVTHTLLLPWLDYTKSYRGTLTQMEAVITDMPDACITTSQVGESIAPMLRYFTPRNTMRGDAETAACPFLLTRTPANAAPVTGGQWQLLWKGRRPLEEKNEELRLYRRT